MLYSKILVTYVLVIYFQVVLLSCHML